MNDLRTSTGGRITWGQDGREVGIEIESRKRVIGTTLSPKERDIEKITTGVFVEVGYDEFNQGHLRVNGLEVTDGNISSALAKGALNPTERIDVLQRGKGTGRTSGNGLQGHQGYS